MDELWRGGFFFDGMYASKGFQISPYRWIRVCVFVGQPLLSISVDQEVGVDLELVVVYNVQERWASGQGESNFSCESVNKKD
jgi:hypothetical protein